MVLPSDAQVAIAPSTTSPGCGIGSPMLTVFLLVPFCDDGQTAQAKNLLDANAGFVVEQAPKAPFWLWHTITRGHTTGQAAGLEVRRAILARVSSTCRGGSL